MPIVQFALLTLLSCLLYPVISQNMATTGLKPVYTFCPRTSNNTASTNFVFNLASLLGKLYAEGGNSLYFRFNYGEDPDKVYALYLCRDDVDATICQNCIDSATETIRKECADTKQAIIWYDECLVRYSNISFPSTMETVPYISMYNLKDVSEPYEFSQTLSKLFDELTEKATSSDSKYAAHQLNVSSTMTVYGNAQCIPNIVNCGDCLDNAAAKVQELSIQEKEGGRILNPSCYLRFELYDFLSKPQAPNAPNDGGRKAKLIAISTTVSAFVVIVLFGSYIWHKRRTNIARKKGTEVSQEIQLIDSEGNKIGYNYTNETFQGERQGNSQELPLVQLGLVIEATQHFSEENKLGEGGFGPVYKGTLVDGKEIAVKRLSTTSGQGLQEFKNEVTLIAKLQHKNLVRLLGCCLEGKELLLIYEYMANKSLDVILFDSTRGAQLDWKTRLGIINGIARGLLYLHEDSRLKIIHRDLKASNVLLDQEMNPKISDFGMARIFGGNQNEANTNRVVGTYGYMAPEYAMEGLFSVKSDVFSFGVLLLEIICGKKNSGFYLSRNGQSLLTFAWKLWSEGQGLELMDPLLVQSCVAAEVLKCIHIGLLCIQEDPEDRPTISSVVIMLGSDTVTLPQPTQPAFSIGRVAARSVEPPSNSKLCSVNDITLSNVSPR